MINKIKTLTLVFLKDYYQKLDIINKEKRNKLKLKYIVLFAITIFALTYLSYKSINLLSRTGFPEAFLKIYLPIFSCIIIIQLIVLVCRLFYFSNDLEYIISHPFKIEEIIIAKLNTIISIVYLMEAMFLAIPLIIYGLIVAKSIIYFGLMILMLVIFPIFFTLVINILMLFFMRLSKLIKNKDVFQLIIIFILTFLFFRVILNNMETILLSEKIENISQLNVKLDRINNMFFALNPIINILTLNETKIVILNIVKLIVVNSSLMLLFIIFGKKLYLKNVLININYIKKNNKIIKKVKYKKTNKNKTYIKKDIINILKTPSFFLQNVFQYACIIIVLLIILSSLIPLFIEQIERENMIENIGIENFKLQICLTFIEIVQILFTFSNISLTAISREGKNAVFMKYIPIPLARQIKLKAVPQIVINTIAILSMLITINFKVSNINIIYYIIIFEMSMMLNILNSYIMVLIDLKKPNLNWINEESSSKNNENKLIPYMVTIIVFLIFSYFAKIFKYVSFIISIIIINIIFLLIFIILKIYINKDIKKIFKKIY